MKKKARPATSTSHKHQQLAKKQKNENQRRKVKISSDSDESDEEEFNDPFLDQVLEDKHNDMGDDDDIDDDDDDDDTSDIDLDKLEFVDDDDDDDDNDNIDAPDSNFDEHELKKIIEEENLIDMSKVEEDNIVKQEEEEALEEENYHNMDEVVYVPDPSRLIPTNYKEQFDYLNEGYDCLHRLKLDWPCLSFDILSDGLGNERKSYPMSLFCVAGLQAKTEIDSGNGFHILKLTDLYRTKDDDKEDSDDENEEEDMSSADIPAKVDNVFIQTKGWINRIKVMPQNSNIVATWSTKSFVQVYDISKSIEYLNASTKPPQTSKLAVVKASNLGHKVAGFALGWSPVRAGSLASGDCQGKIFVIHSDENNTSLYKQAGGKCYTGHSDSVEDIQWSPKEASVFASCSVDRTIGIWDIRKPTIAMQWEASPSCDINVISWNAIESHHLASGDNDGLIKVWDLRKLKNAKNKNVTKSGTMFIKDVEPIAQIDYHKHAITSIEWCPHDESTLVTTCEDNQCSVWDFSVEEDEEQAKKEFDEVKVKLPQQLMFLHMGQTNMKEVHWHHQIPNLILTCAREGLNIFKPINLVMNYEEMEKSKLKVNG